MLDLAILVKLEEVSSASFLAGGSTCKDRKAKFQGTNSKHRTLQILMELALVNFESQLATSVQVIKTILEITKVPRFPSQVPHNYEDKFTLAEFVSTSSFGAIESCLESIGFFSQIFDYSQAKFFEPNQTTTLRFKATYVSSFPFFLSSFFFSFSNFSFSFLFSLPCLPLFSSNFFLFLLFSQSYNSSETCTFIKETKRIIESPAYTVQSTNFLGMNQKTTQRDQTTIEEFHWNFEVEYEFLIFQGTHRNEKKVTKINPFRRS